MKKQKTFESEYSEQDTVAIDWLLTVSKCFDVKKAKLTTYTKKRGKYTKIYCCRVEVEYG